MLAKRLPTILPDMNFERVSKQQKSQCDGLIPSNSSLIVTRPFATLTIRSLMRALDRGGQIPKPGEVSLSHNGVLFLDELPEFKKNVLEVMRQPAGGGEGHDLRAATSLTYPARFMLMAP